MPIVKQLYRIKTVLERCKKFLISLSFIIGGVGGIIFGVQPIFSVSMIAIGVLGSIYAYLASETQSAELKDIIDIQAVLLAQNGLGNVYVQMFMKEMLKNGFVKDTVSVLNRALHANPNDVQALEFLAIYYAMHMSNLQVDGVRENELTLKQELATAKQIVQKGLRLAPRRHSFTDVLGICLDIEGRHKEAREQFRKSSSLRPDPYWRLLMATSWNMSGNHKEAIKELQQAKEQGAAGWVFNLYYGRALDMVGCDTQARKYLELAYAERRKHPEILRRLISLHTGSGRFLVAAKYAYLQSWFTGFAHPWTAMRKLISAIKLVALGLGCPISRSCWKVTQRIPLLRKLHLKTFPPDSSEFSLGMMHIRRGNYIEAEGKFRLSCEIIPDKAESHSNLALSLALQGQRENALEECDIAIQLKPDDIRFQVLREQITSGNMKRVIDERGNEVRKI